MSIPKLLFLVLIIICESKDLVLIGDSRFCGIANSIMKFSYTWHNNVYGTGSYIIGNNAKNYQGYKVKVVAEVGASASTFQNTKKAINQGVTNILGSSKQGTIVLLWLGVNNLDSESTYKYYYSLASKYSKLKFFGVSITGVYESKAKMSNNNIKKFNANLKSKISSSGLKNLHYKSILKKDDPTQIYNSASKNVVFTVNAKNTDSYGLHYISVGDKAIIGAMLAGLK